MPKIKVVKFKNVEEKRDAIIAALGQLLNDLGWLVVKKVLKENIKLTDEKLRGNIEWEEGDTMKVLQRERRDRVALSKIPENLIEEYKEVKQFPPELDPYE